MSTRDRAIELSSPRMSRTAISSSRRMSPDRGEAADLVGARDRLLPPSAEASQPARLGRLLLGRGVAPEAVVTLAHRAARQARRAARTNVQARPATASLCRPPSRGSRRIR
jgi:hypothetical protein